MQENSKMELIDPTSCSSSRDQRAINRNIKRGHDSPSVIATGITTCPTKRKRETFDELWQRRIKREVELWLAEASDEERGCHDLPNRVVLPYQEKPFGQFFMRDDGELALFAAGAAPSVPDSVVSLALFDGDVMLFACSGVALPEEPRAAARNLTRFLTSARLVREFIDKRNKDDKLRVEVRLPDNRATDGFLGLYDDHIAIVTSFDNLIIIDPIDLDHQSPGQPSTSTLTGQMIAFGRAFNSGKLMVQELTPVISIVSDDLDQPREVLFPDFTEAAFGGPLTDANGNFLGVIHHHVHDMEKTSFLPLTFLRLRLKHFGILTQDDRDTTEDAGTSSGGTKNKKRGYSLPPGVSSIVPSGFMRKINMLKSLGYPMPPPLMLEANGQLRNTFEDDFGEVCAWEGYEYSLMWRSTGNYVWQELPKKVFRNLSRRAVSVVSFTGDKIFFACTGLLISWHTGAGTGTGTCRGKRTRPRQVILTSASLVRTRDDEDEIDKNLRIEVFLPPNQRTDGTLELYHSNYNIAIISVEKRFISARPENIFSRSAHKLPKEVVAVGREAAEGLLLASMGKVIDMPRWMSTELHCQDLKMSTCKIKKVGIGGPLITSHDGRFVGMNFYDDTHRTPFLPRSKIVDVLKGIDLPSERGLNCPVNMMDTTTTIEKNRWPVPEAYWYHPLFDDDLDPFRPYVGRVLQ
ncbi:hypothetical protein ACQ4PT_066909 [Festuca glaucescens]